jgi:tetratricopeptide (TPR) repeat protein
MQLISIVFLTAPVDAQPDSPGWRLYRSAAKITENASSKQELLTAQSLLNEPLKIFETEKLVNGSAQALYLMGCLHYQHGLYEAALKSFEESLNLADRCGDMRQEGLILNRIGVIYMQWGDYHKAMYYLEETLKMAGK